MNVLYYIEPSLELNDRLFRLGSLKSIIIPEIMVLKEANPDINITLIVNDILFNEFKKNIKDDKELSLIDKIVLVSETELDNLTNYDSFTRSMLWQNNQYSLALKNKFKKFYIQKLGVTYQPNIIFSYESPVPYLKDAFPKSLVLNTMFGAFSRAPFPSLFTLDNQGLFSNSTQSKLNINDISELDDDEKYVLNKFRKNVIKSLSQNLPCKNTINDISSKFSSIILFACQVDGYFAYNSCLDSNQTQFDVLENILKSTPENIGIIVTSHSYKQCFNEDEIFYLKNTYANVIFLNIDVPGLSQYLISYVDGVVTVSSSLAYQASLWRKPLYVFGKSHINILATDKKIDDFISSVLLQKSIDNDKVLYHLLAHYNFSYRSDVFKNSSKYYSVLEDMYNKHITNKNLYEVRKTPQEVDVMLNQDFRGWLLKDEAKKYSNLIKPDYLRISFSESKVASFDLFDTLVERDFREPHEVFLFIEPKVRKLLNNKNFMFQYFRRQAEADARRPTRGDFEITLDQIYEKFIEITGLNGDLVEKIKKLEIEAELSLVHPKKKMIKEYNFSKIFLDKVSIISDIYLDKFTIDLLLEKNNIKYDSLWVSAETKTRKHNGTIFPDYINWVKQSYPQLQENRMLHVGDNVTADGEMPKSFGMKVYTFPKAIDNLKRSLIGTNYYNKLHIFGGINSSIYSGIVANKFYSSHFNYIRKDNYFNGDVYEYGYSAIGPLVLGFVQWLYHKAKLQNIKTLYFLARDGWLLKKAYDLLYKNKKDAPKSVYLYCSRKAVMSPSIMNIDCILEIADQNFNARSIESFLENRFGLKWDDLDTSILKKHKYKRNDIVSPYYEQKKLKSFLISISELILIKAKKDRDSYIDYLESVGFVNDAQCKQCAVVDIGYSGTMQQYLKKMLNLDTLAGYYFLTHHHSREIFRNDIFEGFLANLDDHKISVRHALNNHVFIFESALSSPEGSLLEIKGKGKSREFIFLEAIEEQRRKSLLLNMHRGVDDFIYDIYGRFGEYIDDIEFSPALCASLIIDFANKPTKIDASMFINFEVENSFGGGSVCLIDYRPLAKEAEFKQLIEKSKWKQGAKVFYAIQAPLPTKTQQVVNKSQMNVSTVTNVTKALETDVFNKKLMKFYRSPYNFFSDSKNPKLNKLKVLFDDDKKIGRIGNKVFEKLVS